MRVSVVFYRLAGLNPGVSKTSSQCEGGYRRTFPEIGILIISEPVYLAFRMPWEQLLGQAFGPSIWARL